MPVLNNFGQIDLDSVRSGHAEKFIRSIVSNLSHFAKGIMESTYSSVVVDFDELSLRGPETSLKGWISAD